jgi:photosystem II stability/assembly factor-like uncharacterized protein
MLGQNRKIKTHAHTLYFLLVFICLIILSACINENKGRKDFPNTKDPGHWKIIRRIEYRKISPSRLKGSIGPAYRFYSASLAGFHTESFGVSLGYDDDVRYTRDGGETWVKTPNALLCRHSLDIAGAQTICHGGNGGIRLTQDGFKTLHTIADFDGPFLSCLNGRVILAGKPLVNTLKITYNGGMVWHDIASPAGLKDIAAIALRTDKDGYVLDTAGNLFVTKDGFTSWEVCSLGLYAGEELITSIDGPLSALRFFDDRHGMTVFCFADKSVWFAVTQDGGRGWKRAELRELGNKFDYYHLYLSRDGKLLTATTYLNVDSPVSIVLGYEQP